jgi:hypothetical protein
MSEIKTVSRLVADAKVDEFEQTLRHAEMLLTLVDDARTEIRRARLFELACDFGSVCVVLVLVGLTPRAWWFGAIALVVLGVADLALARVLRLRTYDPLRRRIRRDEKVIVSAVSVLRELFPLISVDEHWTPIRISRDRMRLGRFPIEPGD